MTLTLRIENHDRLETGGPVEITLDRRGASVGRRGAMDWALPDPQRHISGHHFDIVFSNDSYWLTDVSTNGTFLQGQRHRMEGAHLLAHGDRLVVGHYIIAVTLEQGAPFMPPMPNAGPMGHVQSGGLEPESDPWDFGGAPMQPVDPLPQRGSGAHYRDDMARDFVPLGQSYPTLDAPPFAAPEQAPPAPVPPAQILPTPFPPFAAATPEGALPAAPMPTPEPKRPPQPETCGFVEAFCTGAGLDPALAQGADGAQLAEALGCTLRVAAEETMRMLQDRANVKQFTRSGARTMRSVSDNNPMKFLPDAEQALVALFLRPRDGFMTDAAGFENALSDLRQHQMAVFAALQPALGAVLDGLSPEDIETAAKEAGNLLPGSRKGRSWDLYLERWDAKAQAGDHGMLDAFLQAFTRAYAEAAPMGDDSKGNT